MQSEAILDLMPLKIYTKTYLSTIALAGLAYIFLPVSLLANGELNCSAVLPLATGSCCFSLQYDYNFPQNINTLETRLLNSGVFFSGIQYSLSSGWQYQSLQQQRRLSWSYEDGAEIPAGEQPLFEFCLSGWSPPDSIELLVLWRNGNAIAKRDTLRLACATCWEVQELEVECQPDSSYLLNLDFVNQSGFRVDFLTIHEPNGQDFIVEETILPPSPIAIGNVLEGIELTIRPEADGLSEICLEITPQHQLNDEISLDCCTASYCIPLPDCDRCCTPFADFEMAVNVGFSTTVNCTDESVNIQAIALNDCDQVTFEVEELGGGIVDGNEAITLQGLDEDRWYEVCMTVIRQDRSGTNCFEMAELTTCDSFFYDCDNCLLEEQIDLSFDCPPMLNLVCACDSMTYLNACAAQNWAGVTIWEEGRRCNDPPLEEIPLFATLIVLENATELSWSIGGLVNYRYFLIQRMLPDEEWITIEIVDNMTFSYTDSLPADGLNKYRIVGVAQDGKVVFSNEDQIVDTDHLSSSTAPIKCWPNPFNDIINIRISEDGLQQAILRNIQGQVIKKWPINDWQRPTQLLPPRLATGAYYLEFHFSNGKIYHKKLIKS